MRLRLLAAPLAVVAAVAAVGCPDSSEEGGTAATDTTCPATPCGATQTCLGSKCYEAACSSGPCPTGKGCVGDVCVFPACEAVTCGAGEVCARGACYAKDCPGQPCGGGEVCDQGACLEDLCAGVSCASGVCSHGLCDGGGGDVDGGAGSNDGGQGACDLHGWRGETSLTLTKACSPYTFDGQIALRDGAVLTIEPGVEVRFSAGGYLSVGGYGTGKLVAQGTEAEPIVFTSSQPDAAAGSWGGLFFQDETLSGTVLSHVEIRNGGELGLDGPDACLTIWVKLAGRVSVDHTKFSSCRTAGVKAIWADFAFQSFTGNTFEDCESGMTLDANTFGSVQGAQTYLGSTTRNRVTGGSIDRSVTWPAQPVPYELEGTLEIQGLMEQNNPVLTLEPGTVVRAPSDAGIEIGYFEAGGLVAVGTEQKPIVFESSQPGATPGSWAGIVFWEHMMSLSKLDHVVIRHAGQPTSIHEGGVTCIYAKALVMPITNSLFEQNMQTDISLCQCPGVTESGNTFKSGGVKQGC
jgi:hypothetical protein